MTWASLPPHGTSAQVQSQCIPSALLQTSLMYRPWLPSPPTTHIRPSCTVYPTQCRPSHGATVTSVQSLPFTLHQTSLLQCRGKLTGSSPACAQRSSFTHVGYHLGCSSLLSRYNAQGEGADGVISVISMGHESSCTAV